ncbi:MAG: PQQ-binding-like beta-propeller repeat protein [Bacteroidales bacterium]
MKNINSSISSTDINYTPICTGAFGLKMVAGSTGLPVGIISKMVSGRSVFPGCGIRKISGSSGLLTDTLILLHSSGPVFSSWFLPIILFFFLLFPEPLNSQGRNTGWEIFRGNPALTGVTREAIPQSPRSLWTFEIGDEIKSSPVISNSRIIIGSGDGYVYCLDMQGKLLWKFDSGNTIEAPALIHNQKVYIGNLGGSLYSLEISTGNVVWEYTTDNQIMATPNIWSDGKTELLLIGSYDYYLHAVNPKDGSMVWKYELFNYLNAAVAIENDKAIFGGCDGLLHIVDIRTGKPGEAMEIASYVAGSASLENGRAYVGDYDGRFTAADYINGKILWTWEDKERNLPFIASPSIFENKVIIGNRDRFVYCYNKTTGEVLWRTNTGSRVDASTLTDGKRVLVANMRGDILLLDINTGNRQWSFETGSPISGSPAISEGKIIIGTNDGTIWCFGN